MDSSCIVEYFESISSSQDEANIQVIYKGITIAKYLNCAYFKIYLQFKKLELTEKTLSLKSLFSELEYVYLII